MIETERAVPYWEMLLSLLTVVSLGITVIQFHPLETSYAHPNAYLNNIFWDSSLGYYFSPQKTSNSCIPASIQMVLRYLSYSPIPTQEQLAEEMHTNINRTTKWSDMHTPFDRRGFTDYYNQSLSDEFSSPLGQGRLGCFTDYYNQSLSDDPSDALRNLKGNLSLNLPVIVDTWYDQKAKDNGTVTHARVITGYNSTGIFFHDPLVGPNLFMNNSAFLELWNTSLGYWALMVKSVPHFGVTVRVVDILGFPVQGANVTLREGRVWTLLTDANGTAFFPEVPPLRCTVNYSWIMESGEEQTLVTRHVNRTFRVVFSDRVILLITLVAVSTLFLVWQRSRST
jgi:uncharacterized protein YvpB